MTEKSLPNGEDWKGPVERSVWHEVYICYINSCDILKVSENERKSTTLLLSSADSVIFLVSL